MPFSVREIRRGTYVTDGYSNEDTLSKLMIEKPEKLHPTLTYLWGMDSDKFPLTTMTEGNFASGGVREVNGVEFTWDVMGKARHNEEVVDFDSVNTPEPGKNGTPFFVYFKSNILIEQYGLLAPDGVTRVRIMEAPKKMGEGRWRYTLELKTTDYNYFCPLSNLQPGKFWVMTAPTIPESFSRGNRSNVRGPGKMHNQISFLRYTKHIGGNLANKVVDIEFPTEGGGTTNKWINEEMRQFEIDMRQYNEEHYWTSEYNRLPNGELVMKDYDSGQPIPEGAGVLEQVRENNYDTYGFYLTLQKLKNTISEVFDKDSDTGKMEVVLYCGDGFADDFDMAIKSDVNANGFQQSLGDQMISGSDGALSYGNYFTQYKDIRGNRITLRPLHLLNRGLWAENDKSNGNLHPRTGKPMSSHVGIFIDHSIYNGDRNVRLVRQTGQADIVGVYKGLAPIPASWGQTFNNWIAKDEDASSYERKFSKGINIDNTTGCFMLQCKL